MTNITTAMEEMNAKFAAFRAVAEGATVEDLVDGTDEAIRGTAASFFEFLDKVGQLTGVTTLKHLVAQIIEESVSEEDGLLHINDVAASVHQVILEKAQEMEDCFCEKEAAALRELVKGRSIWTMFAGTVCFITGKLYRGCGKVLGFAEKRLIGKSVIKAIKGVAHVVRAGVKVVVSVATHALSFIGASAIIIADYLIGFIRYALTKVKGFWEKAKGVKLEDTCGTEEEFFFEEEPVVEQ